MILTATLLIPLLTAILLFVFRLSGRNERALALAGSTAHLALAVALLVHTWRDGILTAQMGSWPAPFGITLVGDLIAAIMVLLTAITGLGIVLYSISGMDDGEVPAGFYAIVQFLLFGVTSAFLTGDFFNLYVAFEVLLIASFVLMSLNGNRNQIEGTFKYVVLNLVGSIFFLSGIGLVYSITGTLNMADLSVKLSQADEPLLAAVLVPLIMAFGIKAGVFPLFFWLPASYHTPPIPVSALFAGLLTKVGVYALIRLFTLIVPQPTGDFLNLIMLIAALTMVTGVLGAAAQGDIRRILSFHIISQIGYMVMGIGLLSPLALAGTVFYLIHHIIVKANLFLVAGIIRRIGKSFDLENLGGLYRNRPIVAILFLIPAFSLAGIPPLSGFWAKYILVRAGFEAGEWALATVALLVGLLTIFSMTKIWIGAFWKPLPAKEIPSAGRLSISMLTPVMALACITVLIGLGAEWVFQLSVQTADQLLNSNEYIQAVLEAK